MTDTITLTIPKSSSYRSVATLVLGGIGSRFDVPFERVDDLQLAVLSVLPACREVVTIEVEAADDDAIGVTIGPLEGSPDDPGLRRVVDRLVDAVEASHREGADWLSLRLRRARSEVV